MLDHSCIVYEDAQIVVIDKPAGVASHSVRTSTKPNVADFLLERYSEMRGIGYTEREAGLVHRLDNDTSGLLIAARDRHTFQVLSRALKHGDIQKYYSALCKGTINAPCEIDIPLAPHPKNKRKVKACVHPAEAKRLNARRASTQILKADPSGIYSIVTLKAPIAHRHQIRAHLSAIGHPIVGDVLYKGPSAPELHRHLLHAGQVHFRHPKTGKHVSVYSKLTNKFNDLCKEVARNLDFLNRHG